jgi:hypothetical protein
MRAEKKKRLNLRKGGIENQLTDDANPVTIGLGDQTHSLFTIWVEGPVAVETGAGKCSC